MHLTDPIEQHFRLDLKQKPGLARLRLKTIRDLLYHFPVRYGDVSNVTSITSANDGDTVTLYGRIKSPKTKKAFKGGTPMAEATLTDMSGESIKIVWFNQAFIAKTLNDGDTVKLTGKITDGKYGKTLTNPEIEQTPDLPIDTHDSLFKGEASYEFGYPVYRESRGITSKWFYHAIRKILASAPVLIDPIPAEILTKYKLPSIHNALVWIHTPQKQSHADAARKRFAFEEVFLIQLAKGQSRRAFESLFSFQLDIDHDDVQSFMDRFPFTPTESQLSTIESILADMKSGKPMSRLVEGDVGSGKTFVAATVAYAVTRNRPRKQGGGAQEFGALQVAYMAPTEVLAAQLFENFIEFFRGTGTQIALVTGSGCRKFPSKVASQTKNWTEISRTQVAKWIKNGEIPIVIGTHALIGKKVEFKDLGLVVVDEQHRFGTNQRMKLARKDGHVPHYLSMTATPIPRTLALTIYGDLDLSVIDQMPAGRKPVITKIVPDAKRDESYEHIRSELAAGRQAYVICPRIDEADPEQEQALQLRSVKSEAKRLSTSIFPNARIDVMHSKMTPAKKEEVMKKFHNHDIDILVSTSVVEVGVNVPNATNIIIEGAERFGLAQLHQLRGRVMRGSHQPYCFLFTDSNNDKTKDRLTAFVKAKNGFELAELDLGLRGSGDLAGLKQWGISDVGMEAIKNLKMVEFARFEAGALLDTDPALSNYPMLAAALAGKDFDVHFE